MEISVITSYGGDDGNSQNYINAYKAYEDATGNVVMHKTAVSNEEWKARIIKEFEAGSEPDVLFFFTGADSNSLIGGGRVVSIDEIRSVYPDYASNMQDDMLDASPVDGKKYAVPASGIWEGLYVNKKVLAASGVGIPDGSYTWDAFLSDCEKIKNAGYIPVAASMRDVPHYWFEFAVYNNGSRENHMTLPESAGDEACSAWTAGLGDLKHMFERGYFPSGTLTLSDGEANELFLGGEAAFMLDGSWRLGYFEEYAPDRLDDFTVTYVPAKGERRAQDIIAGLSMGYYITRKAWDDPEKQEACVEFVKSMTSDEVVSTFSAAAVTISALKNEPALEAGDNPLKRDALAMLRDCASMTPPIQDRLGTAARAYLFSNVKNVIAGEITPEQAVRGCLAINE